MQAADDRVAHGGFVGGRTGRAALGALRHQAFVAGLHALGEPGLEGGGPADGLGHLVEGGGRVLAPPWRDFALQFTFNARIEREKKADEPPARSEDAAAAFDKMAQTVRRTLALEARLAAGVKARRETLITERAERRTASRAAHVTAVGDAIVEGLHDAYAATCPDAEYNEIADRLLDDAYEYLGDADEMRGYLDRPIGETVVRLCAAMGLDPDACESDGETWRVRRPPLDFELRLEERARKFPPPLPPSPSGEGQDAKHPGWGSLSASPNPGDDPILPHPDGFAVCPSP